MRVKPTSICGALAAALLGTLAQNARAAAPTVDQCLAASDASLKTTTLRAERAQLVVCSARSCPKEIRQECASRVAEVDDRTPTVRLSVRDAAGAELEDVRVRMDGETIATRLDGKPLPVEPGDHGFTFEAGGQPSVTKRLRFAEREKDRVEVVVLVQTASPVDLAPARGAPASAGEATTTAGTRKVLALVSAGASAVGLGVGIASSVVALSKKSAAEGVCPSTLCPSQAGVDDWSGARTAGNVATAGFVVSGVALAGALTLWLTIPTGRGTTASAGIAPGSLVLRGTW